ncbi:MAG: alpha/beta hydrolase [Caulobacter sp.]|nr:alpha/beta hydrolase [Caulobacter sp.]
MILSRRRFVHSPLALMGASAIGLGAATEAQAQRQDQAGAGEVIALWPRPPGRALHPDMAEVVEQTSSDSAYSSRRKKGISRPHMIARPAAAPNGAAMLIIPGGGFGWNYFEHEGYFVANLLNRAGISCFVLFYRLANDGWDDPASVGPADAQRALRLIRAHAARFRVDPARVGVMGFSAGGFLAATLATRHEARFYAPLDAVDQLSARPLVAAPIYPVQSLDPAYAYSGAAPSFFGGPASAEQIREWSPDLNVGPTTAPTFLAHAEDDDLVPVANTLRLRDALSAARIPVETHLFARGGHGFGARAEAGRPGGRWTPLFLDFARGEGLLV